MSNDDKFMKYRQNSTETHRVVSVNGSYVDPNTSRLYVPAVSYSVCFKALVDSESRRSAWNSNSASYSTSGIVM